MGGWSRGNRTAPARSRDRKRCDLDGTPASASSAKRSAAFFEPLMHLGSIDPTTPVADGVPRQSLAHEFVDRRPADPKLSRSGDGRERRVLQPLHEHVHDLVNRVTRGENAEGFGGGHLSTVGRARLSPCDPSWSPSIRGFGETSRPDEAFLEGICPVRNAERNVAGGLRGRRPWAAHQSGSIPTSCSGRMFVSDAKSVLSGVRV